MVAPVFNDASGSLSITNCTFNGNVALGGNGGSGGPFGGNGGNGDGGAIYNLGAMTIKSATIDGNTGTSGTPGSGTVNGMFGTACGGLFVAGGTATVANTISAGNPGTNSGGGDANGVFVSSGYNLIGNGDFSTGFNASGDQVGTTAAPLIHISVRSKTMVAAPPWLCWLTVLQSIKVKAPVSLLTSVVMNDRLTRRIFRTPRGDGSDIGAFEQGGTVPINAVSRQTHGAAGPFISLFQLLIGNAAAAGRPVIIKSRPLPLPSLSLESSGADHIGNRTNRDWGNSNGGVVSVNGAIVTVPLTNVANAQRITLTLFSASDGANTNNVSVPMGILLGIQTRTP